MRNVCKGKFFYAICMKKAPVRFGGGGREKKKGGVSARRPRDAKAAGTNPARVPQNIFAKFLRFPRNTLTSPDFYDILIEP